MAPVDTDVAAPEHHDTGEAETNTLLDELVAFTRDERNDLAIRLLELNALHVEGDISDEEFAEQRAELYAVVD
jgi:hypothetical protein